MKRTGILLLSLAIALLAGCASQPPAGRAKYALSDFEPPNAVRPLEVSDPIAPANKELYRFNHYFDRFLFLPAVNTYEFIMPDYAEQRVSNFFDNIGELTNFTNAAAQLKPTSAGITLARVLINSTVGIGGLWDPASDWNLQRQDEDFGQTLGHYGTGNGPYVVLPVLGPSNLRDTAGLVADAAAFAVVGGLTANGAAEKLRGCLSEGFLRDPQVTVLVREFNSKKVFVFGEVQKPGTFPFEDGMSIVQAITLAGGFSRNAAQNSTSVTRRVNGQEVKVKVNVQDIALGKAPNVTLEPGDMQFLHNHQILHSRNDFENWPEPERHRHLLRLWLASRQIAHVGAHRDRVPPRFADRILGRMWPLTLEADRQGAALVAWPEAAWRSACCWPAS